MTLHDLDDEHVEQALTEREAGIDRARRGDHPEIPEERVETIRGLSEDDQIRLLGMTMESLRGNWTRIEEREAILHFLATEIDGLPAEYLPHVRWNTYLCNGHLIDGRIFRDGDRRNGMHGSLTGLVVGDDRTEGKDGWRGTYRELWNMGHEPSEDDEERLAKYIPNDLTYTLEYETCVWRERPPVEPDAPHARPLWADVGVFDRFDSRVPRILGKMGGDGESQVPFGVRHVIRPDGEHPVVIHL